MVTIADYFKNRRQGITKHVAEAFGIPFPVKKGWLETHGPREITEYMAQKLLSRPATLPKVGGYFKMPKVPKEKKQKHKHGPVVVKKGGVEYVASNIDPTSKAFLTSFEWRSLRMQALKMYGAKCMCCGATPATGAVMNVDHIKPRKFYPGLALSIDNLQILCDQCNHGKGNWDQTDWRKK